MQRWHGSCIGALAVLLIGGASLIFFVPMGGAMIAAMPPLFDRLTAHALCPDAVDYSYEDYGFGQPTGSSPSRGTGHYTELTCTNADGSEQVFSNEEVGLKGLGAAFGLSAICGGAAVLALALLAAGIGARLVKPKSGS
jgi:hypothetical protein